MPRTSRNLAEYWDAYKPSQEDALAPEVASFEWTQYPGHGPGAEILGRPRRALELGCAEGKEAVYLARRGVEVTALDLSPVQVARARRWWDGTAGLTFEKAEACAYLASAQGAVFDAIYSVWGAVWFTDPEDLVPLVARCLRPGGVFAFSQAEPLEGHYGRQGMYGNGLSGRRLVVQRWSFTPDVWADMLKRNGFVQIDARVIDAPDAQNVGTLMVQARI